MLGLTTEGAVLTRTKAYYTNSVSTIVAYVAIEYDPTYTIVHSAGLIDKFLIAPCFRV